MSTLQQIAPVKVGGKDKLRLYLIFLISGFPALLYQIVWERVLFTLYGVNIQSVTMIVTIFMLGLGLGSLAGGWLSSRPNTKLLLSFSLIECCIGIFGLASLRLFHSVGAATAGASLTSTGLFAFGLLIIPTFLMGSTLPLLVEYFVRRTGNVGESVGTLYAVNTFGSGLACLLAALFIMRSLGEQGTTWLAACFNLTVGISAFFLFRQLAPVVTSTSEQTTIKTATRIIPFRVALLLAGCTGFIALAYEIVWYRLYSLTSGGTAACFAKLLAFYLFGIAYGSFAISDICKQKLRDNLDLTLRTTSYVVLGGSIVSFLLGPLLSLWVAHITNSYEPTFVFVFLAAALFGSTFPLLSQAAIGQSGNAGQRLSLLYLSNIIGSALGSFLIGFIVLDHWSTHSTCLLLLALGFTVAVVLAILAGGFRKATPLFVLGSALCVVLAASSNALFSGMFERLITKSDYKSNMRFPEVVENKSGLITVDASETVFGGGVYDGRFNTDLVKDSNGIFRAYAIAGMHARPTNVLMIGLSSGSWAQVIVNNPKVESLTIVEINPGYIQLIAKHRDVSGILQNPKVHIVIDDGRRWLVGHPDERFDFIVMNTSFSWRANASILLSRDFLSLIRSHLNDSGIAYYNTTSSQKALKTGASSFPYALGVSNFIAVSDSPFSLDKERWSKALKDYRIEGNAVLNLNSEIDRRRFGSLVHSAGDIDGTDGFLESRESIMRRLEKAQIITDDNMASEWRD